MATASGALQAYGEMNTSLVQINRAAELAAVNMQRMQGGVRNQVNVISISARQNVIHMENQMKAVEQEAVKKSEKANSLFSTLKGMAAKYLQVENMKKGFDLVVGGAIQLEQQLLRMSGLLGSKEAGSAFFERLNQHANQSARKIEELSEVAGQFMQITKNEDDLMGLTKMSERMAMMDPAQSLKGSGAAIKAALQGDFSSLETGFGFSKEDQKILQEAQNIEGFIAVLDELLQQKGATDQALEELNQSAAAQLQNLQSNLATSAAQAGSAALEAFKPFLAMLNEGFQSGKFQGFFNMISNGLEVLAEAAAAAGSFILDNMDMVKNILVGIGLVVGVVLAVMAVQWIAAWISAVWPVLLIIGAVALLLHILNQFGISTEAVVGFVMGCFAALFAVIWNNIASMWNMILVFAEFLANIFVDPVYGIQKLYYDLNRKIVEYMHNMLKSAEDFAGGFMTAILQAINGVLSGFNWMIDKINALFGTDFMTIQLLDETNKNAISSWYQAKIDQLQPPSTDKAVWDSSKYRMKEMDGMEAFSKGYGFGSELFSKAADAFDLDHLVPGNNNTYDIYRAQSMPGDSGAYDIQNVDKVGEIGSIRDTVDISSEDLKLMRDVAEQQAIQRFTTASLAPQISMSFGDIRETADVDTVAKHIEKILAEQIASTAEGVYA